MSLTEQDKACNPSAMVQGLEDAILRAWKGADRDLFTFAVNGEIIIKADDFELIVKSKRLDAQFDKRIADIHYKAQAERRAENKFRRGYYG